VGERLLMWLLRAEKDGWGGWWWGAHTAALA